MKKTAWVVLADGFEEIEGIAPIDVLRRGGVRVTVAGLGKKRIETSRKLAVEADVIFRTSGDLPDAIILPGGLPGAANLARSAELSSFIKKMNEAKKIIAAICASPAAVLAEAGILDGKKATCYPGCETNFSKSTLYVKKRVVADGNIITSQGPGSALEFSLEILKQLAGKEMAETVSGKMLIKM